MYYSFITQFYNSIFSHSLLALLLFTEVNDAFTGLK